MSIWRVRWGVVVVISFALTGCFSWGGWKTEVADTNPRFYIVDVERGETAQSFARDRVLLLKPVKVVPQFQDKTIIFRTGENEYQSQPLHELLIEPDDMLTSQLQRWLQKSGLFSKIVSGESAATNADYVLETAVTALYGEQRPAFPAQAVMEMQFFLTDAKNEENLLFQTGLRVDVDVESTTPGNVVKGWKQGLEELLMALEQDFSGFFAKLDNR